MSDYDQNAEGIEKRNVIGTVLIVGLVVFMLTLGVVIALALMGPTMGPGIYSNVMIEL